MLPPLSIPFDEVADEPDEANGLADEADGSAMDLESSGRLMKTNSRRQSERGIAPDASGYMVTGSAGGDDDDDDDDEDTDSVAATLAHKIKRKTEKKLEKRHADPKDKFIWHGRETDPGTVGPEDGQTNGPGNGLNHVEAAIEVVKEATGVQAEEGAARANDEAGDHDSPLVSQSTKLRDMQVCANGLKSMAAGWQETSSGLGAVATTFTSTVAGLRAAGVPVHRSFLLMVQLLQLDLFRVAWWSATILTSPYYNMFYTSAQALAQFAIESRMDLLNKRGKIGFAPAFENVVKLTEKQYKKWRRKNLESLDLLKPQKKALGSEGFKAMLKEMSPTSIVKDGEHEVRAVSKRLTANGAPVWLGGKAGEKETSGAKDEGGSSDEEAGSGAFEAADRKEKRAVIQRVIKGPRPGLTTPKTKPRAARSLLVSNMEARARTASVEAEPISFLEVEEWADSAADARSLASAINVSAERASRAASAWLNASAAHLTAAAPPVSHAVLLESKDLRARALPAAWPSTWASGADWWDKYQGTLNATLLAAGQVTPGANALPEPFQKFIQQAAEYKARTDQAAAQGNTEVQAIDAALRSGAASTSVSNPGDVASMAETSSNAADTVTCVRNALSDLMDAGAFVPRSAIVWMMKLQLAAQVVYQMFQMLFVSRPSGWAHATILTRLMSQYANAMWLAAISGTAQRGASPYAAAQWMSPSEQLTLGLPG